MKRAILPLCLLLLTGTACQETTSPEAALLQAAADGDTDSLIRACRRGGHLNTVSADGETPLGLALERLKRGEAVTGSGDTPQPHGWHHIELLLRAGANPNTPHRHTTPLHLAVATGNPEVVRLLLRYGANPNAETRSCLAPIWQAVYTGNAVIAAQLLQAGANPQARDARGMTPVQYLRREGTTAGSLYRLLR